MRKIIYLIFMLILLVLLTLLPSGSIIPEAYAQTTLTPLAIDAAKGGVPIESSYLPDNAGYSDESITVSIEQTRAYDTTILIARITIKDASQLRTAMAGRYGTTTQAPGAYLAKRVDAVFAINGDYYNFDSKGYVLRQGHLYRDNPAEGSDVLLIDDTGDFHVILDATSEKIAAFEGTVINSFSFGPALVVDGKTVESEFINNIGFNKKTQRMVFAQTGPLEYLCVATEGPENDDSLGLTISEITEFMATFDCTVAYNLDGGSSSTMVLNNKKINALSTRKTRSLCDIIYFATLVGQ